MIRKENSMFDTILEQPGARNRARRPAQEVSHKYPEHKPFSTALDMKPPRTCDGFIQFANMA